MEDLGGLIGKACGMPRRLLGLSRATDDVEDVRMHLVQETHKARTCQQPPLLSTSG